MRLIFHEASLLRVAFTWNKCVIPTLSCPINSYSVVLAYKRQGWMMERNKLKIFNVLILLLYWFLGERGYASRYFILCCSVFWWYNQNGIPVFLRISWINSPFHLQLSIHLSLSYLVFIISLFLTVVPLSTLVVDGSSHTSSVLRWSFMGFIVLFLK